MIRALLLLLLLTGCGTQQVYTAEEGKLIRLEVPCGYVLIDADTCTRSGDRVTCNVGTETVFDNTDCDLCPDEAMGCEEVESEKL